MLSAIIVAGGSSRRMGFDKTFAPLADRPVIAHSIAAFEAALSVTEIILVGREDRLEELRRLATAKVSQIIPGGVHRQDSVANGLRALSRDAQFVAVHDAARPLVRPEQIEKVLARARETGAAALASPVRDTLKRTDADRFVSGSISREDVYAMETPQIFARELLVQAYAAVASGNISITDEVSAVEQLGHRVGVVPNEQFNFKLTYPADLPLAELILRGRS